MKFFNDCKTIEEVKATYKKLAMQHHPDRGGDVATMQAINAEYSFATAYILKNGQAAGTFTQEDTDREMNFSEAYREAIEKIINLPEITIELVGNWIWVTGNTFPVKDTLKGAGFFFASKKCAWYFRTEEFKTKGGRKSLDEIRTKYGSEKVAGKSYHRVTAA